MIAELQDLLFDHKTHFRVANLCEHLVHAFGQLGVVMTFEHEDLVDPARRDD